MRLVPALLGISLIGCAPTQLPGSAPQPLGSPVQFSLWLDDSLAVDGDPRFTGSDGHPCGAVAFLQGHGLPGDMAGLEAEVVSEVSPAGATIASWRVPVDYQVEDLRGEFLGVRFGPHAVWINREGRFFARRNARDRTVGVPCAPAVHASDSAYLICFDIDDSELRTTRTIVAEAVCT